MTLPLPNNPHVIRLLGEYTNYSPEIQQEIIKLSLKMTSFGFLAKFVRLEEGPIVRTYFYAPEPSTQLSIIYAREDDLALSLCVNSVMVARELGWITIAVPRKDKELIRFDSCLHSFFSSADKDSSLPILMGKSMKGELLFMDLAKQPHLLIAGTTGSGKSVFTAQAICSLALCRSPEEMELILVDTKQLDLVLFKDLAHVSKIVQDIHALRDELQDLLSIVRDRTSRLSGHARNITEYNQQRVALGYKPMAMKVLIVDEFADIVTSDREFLKSFPPRSRPDSIETLILRIAQISRAVGIHIILATQRPSIKIISGDIKTNFPARIAFLLPTMQDSRVVLDENGAEKLLGDGDYLYKISNSSVVRRGHGAFISMDDIGMILSQNEMLRTQFKEYNK